MRCCLLLGDLLGTMGGVGALEDILLMGFFLLFNGHSLFRLLILRLFLSLRLPISYYHDILLIIPFPTSLSLLSFNHMPFLLRIRYQQ